MISYGVKGFPYEYQIEKFFIYCNGSFCIFPTRNIFNLLIDFNSFNCNILSKAQYSLFLLKVPLNPYQSIHVCTVLCKLIWSAAQSDGFTYLSQFQCGLCLRFFSCEPTDDAEVSGSHLMHLHHVAAMLMLHT